jgi:uncharacterized protein (DUF1330 family)
MAGYLIANIDVKDPSKFEEYRQQVAPAIKKFGGRYLVRGGDLRRLDGDAPLNRLVVVEFPTVEVAQRFYDSAEYQPILKLLPLWFDTPDYARPKPASYGEEAKPPVLIPWLAALLYEPRLTIYSKE